LPGADRLAPPAPDRDRSPRHAGRGGRARTVSMEFGIFVTSQPNPASEPYPHRSVHERVTAEILESERLGYDTAWVAEHHFSNRYGIMPDVFCYLSYLAAR